MDETENNNGVKTKIDNEKFEGDQGPEEEEEDNKSIYHSALNLQDAEIVCEINEENKVPMNGIAHSSVEAHTPMLVQDNSRLRNENYKEHLKITELHLFLPWMSLTLYLFDVCSDQILAFKYFSEKHWIFASLTCLFVLIPALYISVFVGKTWKSIIAKGWKWWPLIIPLVFFNLEPAVQYVQNFFMVRKYIRAKKNNDLKLQKQYYDSFINGNRRVSDLKYSESLMEAVPQFILQGYILLTTYDTLVWNDKLFLQFGSLASSIIGLGVIIFIRHKVYLLDNGMQVTSFGRSLWTCGRFFSLVARTIAITTLASLSPELAVGCFGLHWTLCAVWRYITHCSQLGWFESWFQAGADTLVARVDTLHGNIISHALLLAEDVACMVVWYIYGPDSFASIRVPYVSVVIFINISGCVTDVLYKIYNYRFTSKIRETVV